jgi:urea transport system permease protein
MLGALFVLVTLLLPKGIVGTVAAWSGSKPWKNWRQQHRTDDSAAAEDGVIVDAKPAE